MAEHLSARQRRPSMAKRKKRRLGAFSRRLSFSDFDGRTNAGKYANSIKNDLERQIGNPSAAQQILIKLIAVKMLRCEMMYDQVLSTPKGGNLQDRIENYFLAWSNSIRRDLEALGALAPPSEAEALLDVDPAFMTDEELDAAIALVERHQAIMARALERWGAEARVAEIEAPPEGGEAEAGVSTSQGL
jgi:hypothetical protein